MVGLVRLFIRVYQYTLSPLLRVLCGPASGCRFTPTCSAYFLQAVEMHGVGYGSWLGLKRLSRCHPWGGLGHDPVPPVSNHESSIDSLPSVATFGPTRAE